MHAYVKRQCKLFSFLKSVKCQRKPASQYDMTLYEHHLRNKYQRGTAKHYTYCAVNYEGRSLNSANGFVILFRDMLGKHTMHVSKCLHFAFQMVPNTVQKHFPCSVATHSVRP